MCYLQIHIFSSLTLLHEKNKQKTFTYTHTHGVTFTQRACSAPEAAKQLLDNFLRANATRLFPLFAFLRNGRRNEMAQIATNKTAPLQIGPIIVHLERAGPVIVFVATFTSTCSTTPL